MSVNVVAYYRVSTQKQGRSGLGLDAQRAAIRRFAEDECLTISAEHIEIETGKGADALERRPELAKARGCSQRQMRSGRGQAGSAFSRCRFYRRNGCTMTGHDTMVRPITP